MGWNPKKDLCGKVDRPYKKDQKGGCVTMDHSYLKAKYTWQHYMNIACSFVEFFRAVLTSLLSHIYMDVYKSSLGFCLIGAPKSDIY